MTILNKIKQSDIAQRIISGAFWTFTGTALGKLCVLIAGFLCARILGKELFGQLGMVRSTINMFIVLGASGFGVTATKYISQLKATNVSRMMSICKLTYRFTIIAGIIITILILCFSGLIARYSLNETSLTTTIQFGSILLFFSIIYGVQNGILTGFEAFKSIATNTFIGSFIQSIFMIAGAYYYGVNGAILGFGIGVISIYIVNKVSIKRKYHEYRINASDTHIRKEDYKIIINYSIPATLSALTVTPAFWLVRTILVRHEGYATLASFEAADQWRIMMLFIPTAISQIALPILSCILNDNKKFKDVLLVNLGLITVISTLIVLFILFFGESMMNMYGKDFTDKQPLIYLAISTIFSSASNLIEMSIYSKNKMWGNLLLNFVWALSMILMSDILVGRGFGATGLAIAVLISYVIKTICMSGYIKYILRNERLHNNNTDIQ